MVFAYGKLSSKISEQGYFQSRTHSESMATQMLRTTRRKTKAGLVGSCARTERNHSKNH
uniref:Uncharacterized protein n=1 Tax=Candidatus Kentrum sp. LFY TaxID=2126342 RepID=A0A450UWI9_9GAMM|nr:MAG: hypothetical protein BECKLFY1418A_GA0070994_106417 [Candidatus Kentron sp. LFY]